MPDPLLYIFQLGNWFPRCPVHDIFPWMIWGDTRSVECRVMLRRPEMIVSAAGVVIEDSSVVLSTGVLFDLVLGKDSTVQGTSDWYISG